MKTHFLYIQQAMFHPSPTARSLQDNDHFGEALAKGVSRRTLDNVSCNLSLLHARQAARDIVQCNTPRKHVKKFVSALPQSLRKVERNSTSCYACCNECYKTCSFQGVLLQLAIFVVTYVIKKLRGKLQEKFPSVKAPGQDTYKLSTVISSSRII